MCCAGAGDGERARVASITSVLMAAGLIAFAITGLFLLRDKFALLYTSDPRVLEVASQIVLVYFVHMAFSGINFAMQGTLRGCGRQVLQARVSLISWYLVGLPSAAALCFGTPQTYTLQPPDGLLKMIRTLLLRKWQGRSSVCSGCGWGWRRAPRSRCSCYTAGCTSGRTGTSR